MGTRSHGHGKAFGEGSLMASQMPSRVCKGDKVRINGIANCRKYNALDTDVFNVISIDKIGSSPRLYVERDGRHAKWASSCFGLATSN